MVKTNLFEPTDRRKVTDQKGCFSVLEYDKEVAVSNVNAMKAYFISEMNVHKRQLCAQLNNSGLIVQFGAVQMVTGTITAKGKMLKMLKKVVDDTMTGESAIKTIYKGSGNIVMKPTYQHILMERVDDWEGGMVIKNGLFLACEDTATLTTNTKNIVSSITLGREGFYHIALSGKGIVAFESPVPESELIVVELKNDTLRLDGNLAIAWSGGLTHKVGKVAKTLFNSVVSGEGVTHEFKGTGRVLIAPIGEERQQLIQD